MSVRKSAAYLVFVLVTACGGSGSNDNTSEPEFNCPSGESCYRFLMAQHLATSKSRIANSNGLSSCLLDDDNQWAIKPPEILVDTREQGLPLITIQTTTFLNVNASRWYFNNDSDAGERAILGLENWALANAHSEVLSIDVSSGRFYPSYMLAGAALNSLFLLDNHPLLNEERRSRIIDWIEGILSRTTIFTQLADGEAGGFNDQEQRINNHNARRAFVLLQYGIHTNNAVWVDKSIVDIQRSYDAFDENNIPRDAARGNWALAYINLALDTMTMHPSLMNIIRPGYMEDRPQLMSSLDDAASFLFREMRNPVDIHQYASENFGRPQNAYNGTQDFWFTEKVAEGINFAWIDNLAMDQYMPNAKLEMVETYRNNFWFNEPKWVHTDGNVTCWFPE